MIHLIIELVLRCIFKFCRRSSRVDYGERLVIDVMCFFQSGWLKEMSEGLVENNNRTVKEKTESDGNEEEIILPKTVNAEDRKTNRLRRKERQRVEEVNFISHRNIICMLY